MADLGTDKIHAYIFDPVEGLIVAKPEFNTHMQPGSGPRHLDFSPDEKYAYVINELNCTITTLKRVSKTRLYEESDSISTVPDNTDMDGVSTAEIKVHPSGKFVYGSNRGHDSIAIFSRDMEHGELTKVDNFKIGVERPRNFSIDPSGQFLLAAGQDSHDIRSFRIDQTTGKLTPTD